MRPKSNSTLQRLNLATEIIRQEGKISHARLAVRMNVGLAALEKYRPALLDLFDDLRFEDYHYYTATPKTEIRETTADRILSVVPDVKERRKK